MRVLFLALAAATTLALGAAAQDVSSVHRNQSTPDESMRSMPDGSMPDGRWGHGHAENHDWYRTLKQPGTGYSCCNGTADGTEGDCRPTRAYLTERGTWKALVDGQWQPVPPSVVLKQLAPDG